MNKQVHSNQLTSETVDNDDVNHHEVSLAQSTQEENQDQHEPTSSGKKHK